MYNLLQLTIKVFDMCETTDYTLLSVILSTSLLSLCNY